MLTVAIATEYDGYDAEIYRDLLNLLLDDTVERWPTDIRFSGYKSVRKLAKPFLLAAAAKNVRHALIAIDNDTTSRSRPEHEDDHEQAIHAADENNGCRHCWVGAALPPVWAEGGKHCIVVPVRCIETWLLSLRGKPISQFWTCEKLKSTLFGEIRRVATRLEIAREMLRAPDAITILRQHKSFRSFESQLVGWR